ncbi:MAG TPA: 2-amino-4-hydroxy-6-hydroxymethyldihydropteridine diphosphokinase [Woeseiaceae bacterium]|nr:2-amino-4-hydroxy-6-hydroxymethyldihydropteridine diphosphokinase [Woeseiaceae bacterium]
MTPPERKPAVAKVYLGLGSNISAEENLALGIRELRWRFGSLNLSPVYRNAALGFAGDDFLNMVVGLETSDPPEELLAQIELIHALAGRNRGSGRYTSRPLDIDLLLYGDQVLDLPRCHVPRSDVLEYSFVLRPLAEIAPALVHPETGKTMLEHWQAFDAQNHALQVVHLVL